MSINSEPPVLPDLAAYQRVLLETLYAGESPADVRRKLKSAVPRGEFGPYVEGMEDRMILVASQLVRKWAQRGGEN